MNRRLRRHRRPASRRLLVRASVVAAPPTIVSNFACEMRRNPGQRINLGQLQREKRLASRSRVRVPYFQHCRGACALQNQPRHLDYPSLRGARQRRFRLAGWPDSWDASRIRDVGKVLEKTSGPPYF